MEDLDGSGNSTKRADKELIPALKTVSNLNRPSTHQRNSQTKPYSKKSAPRGTDFMGSLTPLWG
jgi:hypothetical protein